MNAAVSLALAAVLVEGGSRTPPPMSLTAEDAAARLRINRKTICGMCQRRAVRCYRGGRQPRVSLRKALARAD